MLIPGLSRESQKRQGWIEVKAREWRPSAKLCFWPLFGLGTMSDLTPFCAPNGTLTSRYRSTDNSLVESSTALPGGMLERTGSSPLTTPDQDWKFGANTTTKNVCTGRPGKSFRLRCSVMMAQPACHNDKDQKTLASGGPKKCSRSTDQENSRPAGPDMGSTSAQLQSIRDAFRIWR